MLEGSLQHKDNLGNGSVIRPGDVQRMSAGKGVLHSEFNPSQRDPVHFLQIWIEPNAIGIPAGYEEKHFDAAAKRGKLCLAASNDGRDGSVMIHQDAVVYAVTLDINDRILVVLLMVYIVMPRYTKLLHRWLFR